ncbi:SLATT domain-containing protein [Vibrio parahaemolyticus]|nr:SLATT domain-containing protein [Vibrio parahaemolyticus]EGR0710849.1 SLATT domain-containing protein [Vibrio alginolyticus]EJU9837117.1 SLATT domain-containing protein [Vibrio parahaemolyticus]EKO5217500.1 SLATT domain-containing protein [Vibrio parahaemolyticus]HCH1030977.1 SLATT domain-containing protein [Vibrio parahaemolyticus]
MDKDNIWWTRKNWINAEKRLKSMAAWSNLALFWYSLCGVFASVLLLGAQQPDLTSKLFICFSVFVFCASLLSSLGRYSDRAAKLKNGYIQLQALYSKVKHKESLSEEDMTRYTQILDSCENHFWPDFINSKVEAYLNTKDKNDLTIVATKLDFVFYFGLRIVKVISIAAIMFAPVLIIFFSIFKEVTN